MGDPLLDLEACVEFFQTSMMERFVEKANGYKPLTIVAKKLHHRCFTECYIRP